ncbi:MAG TPA: proton-conducting transporter membrane subunit [Anaerolineales bacterium]|nr:proton-conducting transporter membrane subunit [Anaerolineales bacterium]
MSAPLLILILGGTLAVASFVLRGRGTAWLIAAGGSILLAGVALGIVLGEPFEVLGLSVRLDANWTFLGRSLVLRAENRPLVTFLFLAGGLLLTAAWASDAPRRLAPLGLTMLLALAAAMMIEPFVFAPTLIAAAAIVGCLVVVRPAGASGRAAPRLMVSYCLGMMAILIAGWLIEIGGATAAPESPARTASILLGLGLAILVITPPFHTWLTATADEAHPAAFAFVSVLLQTSGLFLLVTSLGSYAWMRTDPLVYAFLRGIGLLMIALGGAWCLVERRIARLVAYALLVDFGISLLALSLGTSAGARMALGMAGARPLALAVWVAGVGNLFRGPPVAGGASRPIRRWAAVAAIAGALSVAGFPLTAGFPGRWMTLTAVASASPWVTAAALFGLAATWLAVGRWVIALLSHPADEEAGLSTGREIVLGGGTALIVLFGLLPAGILAWAMAALGQGAGS